MDNISSGALLRDTQNKAIKLTGTLSDNIKHKHFLGVSSSGRKHLGKTKREYRAKIDGANTLLRGDYCSGQSTQNYVVEKENDELKIRNLTIGECERLMTWETDHTKYGKIDGRVIEIPEVERYKMCGNGVISNKSKYFVNLINHLESIRKS